MGKRGKTPKRMLSLDEQLAEHDRAEPPGPIYTGRYGHKVELEAPSSERMAWVRRRLELTDAIRRRDSKRLDDPGRVAGNFSPSPYALRGHHVELAPKALGKELPKDSQFPKRVTTQRVIDRLRARGCISHIEWRAANALWEQWCAAIAGDRLVAAYEFITTYATPNTDRLVEKRLDAAMSYLDIMALVPKRCRGIVIHVVINDWELSAWGLRTVKSERARRQRGERRLSQGLSALAARLGC